MDANQIRNQQKQLIKRLLFGADVETLKRLVFHFNLESKINFNRIPELIALDIGSHFAQNNMFPEFLCGFATFCGANIDFANLRNDQLVFAIAMIIHCTPPALAVSLKNLETALRSIDPDNASQVFESVQDYHGEPIAKLHMFTLDLLANNSFAIDQLRYKLAKAMFEGIKINPPLDASDYY